MLGQTSYCCGPSGGGGTADLTMRALRCMAQ